MTSLRAADDYLRVRSPKAARDFREEIAYVARLIEEFPEMAPIVAAGDLRCHITRRFKYRITYKFTGSFVEIRDILHPSRAGP